MEVLLLAVMAASNILCFMIGAKVGQAVTKGKDVEMPSVNPMKAIREHKARTEAEQKQDRYETILHNIDNYDGTSNGQREVPRG
jgi:hypothetical protein